MNKVRLIRFLCLASLLAFAIAFPSHLPRRNTRTLPRHVNFAHVGPLISPANCMARLTAFAYPQFGMERCWCSRMVIATKPTIRAKSTIGMPMWRRVPRSKLRFSLRDTPLPVPPIAIMAGKSREGSTTRKI